MTNDQALVTYAQIVQLLAARTVDFDRIEYLMDKETRADNGECEGEFYRGFGGSHEPGRPVEFTVANRRELDALLADSMGFIAEDDVISELHEMTMTVEFSANANGFDIRLSEDLFITGFMCGDDVDTAWMEYDNGDDWLHVVGPKPATLIEFVQLFV